MTILDDPALHEQWITGPQGEESRILGRRGGRIDRARSATEHEPGSSEDLVQRAVREVGGHDRVGTLPDEDGGLDRDRLVVGQPQPPELDDRLAAAGCPDASPPPRWTAG